MELLERKFEEQTMVKPLKHGHQHNRPNKNRNSRFQSIEKSFARNWQLYAPLLPTWLYFLIFHYVPMSGVQIAFKVSFARPGIVGSPWIGLENSTQIINSYYACRLINNPLILHAYMLVS